MEEPAVEMAMVGVEGDHRKEEGKEVLPAGEGMEPVEVFFFIVWGFHLSSFKSTKPER